MKKILALITVICSLSLHLFAARPVRGVYEVPTTDELKSFSKFPVKFDGLDYNDNPSQFNFPLPVELTGVPQNIEMKVSANNPSQWTGPKASGECQTVDRNLQCKVKFHDLAFEPLAAEEIIRQKFSTPSEIEGRIQLMRFFGGEPIGILSYKLRGRDREK